jgi:hypothetical protein
MIMWSQMAVDEWKLFIISVSASWWYHIVHAFFSYFPSTIKNLKWEFHCMFLIVERGILCVKKTNTACQIKRSFSSSIPQVFLNAFWNISPEVQPLAYYVNIMSHMLCLLYEVTVLCNYWWLREKLLSRTHMETVYPLACLSARSEKSRLIGRKIFDFIS